MTCRDELVGSVSLLLISIFLLITKSALSPEANDGNHANTLIYEITALCLCPVFLSRNKLEHWRDETAHLLIFPMQIEAPNVESKKLLINLRFNNLPTFTAYVFFFFNFALRAQV